MAADAARVGVRGATSGDVARVAEGGATSGDVAPVAVGGATSGDVAPVAVGGATSGDVARVAEGGATSRDGAAAWDAGTSRAGVAKVDERSAAGVPFDGASGWRRARRPARTVGSTTWAPGSLGSGRSRREPSGHASVLVDQPSAATSDGIRYEARHSCGRVKRAW